MVTRNLSRRRFLQMSGVATGGLLMAACAPPAATPAATQVPDGPTAAPTPVTLSTNEYYLGGTGYEPVDAEYRAVFDANGLDWLQWKYEQTDATTLDVRLAAGDAPDLLFLYPELAVPWAARKQLVGLNSAINADPTWKADHDTFIPSMNGGYTYKGELYGLTTAAEAEVISYNPDQFAKHGVPNPEEVGEADFTLDKFQEMIQAVTDDTMKGWYASFGYNNGLGDILYNLGGQYFSEDGKTVLLNSPEFVEAVGYVVKQFHDGWAVNGVESNKQGEWICLSLANQKAATAIAGDWCWGWAHKTQLERNEFQPAMYYVPAGPAGRRPLAHSAGVGAYAKSEQLDAVMQYLKFGFTKQYQEIGAKTYEHTPRYPGRHDAATVLFENNILPEAFAKFFDNSLPSPATPMVNIFGIIGYWDDAWNNVLIGADTRPLQEVQDELNERTQKDMDAAAAGLDI